MPIRIMHNIQGEYYMQTMHNYAQYSGEYNMHNIQGEYGEKGISSFIQLATKTGVSTP